MQNAKTCQGLAELEILVPPRELEAPKATVTSLGWFANEGRKLWKMLCVCVCVCVFLFVSEFCQKRRWNSNTKFQVEGMTTGINYEDLFKIQRIYSRLKEEEDTVTRSLLFFLV